MKEKKTPQNREKTGPPVQKKESPAVAEKKRKSNTKALSAAPAEKIEETLPQNRKKTGARKPAAKKAADRAKLKAQQEVKVRPAGSEATQFKPGQSGNPGGRPKMPEEIRDMFREISPRACEVLCEIINDHRAKNSDRIRAAEVILDRAWGKPRQQVDLDTAGVPTVIFMNGDNVAD